MTIQKYGWKLNPSGLGDVSFDIEIKWDYAWVSNLYQLLNSINGIKHPHACYSGALACERAGFSHITMYERENRNIILAWYDANKYQILYEAMLAEDLRLQIEFEDAAGRRLYRHCLDPRLS